ncbi:MAG: four-helix bundle copper-binding protein [Gemmatimonadales bacterium]
MAHQTTSPQISREMQECIEECLRCHGICLQTVSHCLELGGKHADPAHIGLLLDCAEICQTSANVMLRNSDRHQLTCRVCADICRACAEDCERIAGDDKMMKQCADECRRCQQSCELMAA